MDNSSLTSMDWPEWIAATSSSDSDGGVLLPDAAERSTLQQQGESSNGGTSEMSSSALAAAVATAGGELVAGAAVSSRTTTAAGKAANGLNGHKGQAGARLAAPPPQVATTTIRMAFYAVAASFDRRQLETRLKTTYGSSNVHKYPDVIHVQTAPGKNGGPGSDVFFFDFGVVACWALTQEQEREVVRNLAVQCAVQPLPEKDHETDVFRCTYTSNPEHAVRRSNDPNGQPTGQPITNGQTPTVLPAASLGSMSMSAEFDDDSSPTVARRITRRAQRAVAVPTVAGPAAVGAVAATAAALGGGGGGSRVAAAVAAPAQAPPEPEVEELAASAAGPFSLLTFAPRISDDTVMLHVRHIGDIATQLAVSYGLAQSTKMCVFEKATEALGQETEPLPVLLAEHGLVHLDQKEIGQLLGRVFVLKRSVNLLGSVLGTPEFFWYAPDQMQALYSRITEYVELSTRAQLLNGRFEVLQELLELLRAQEENRHGVRLELVIIWLIVVEVVLGVFELLEMFGVIGPKHGGGMF
ncbi:hypothetical protein HYH03_017029 [Edaphochlamys debaryana]|uniref:DUF155 domain-containing protein n=1 Tax=Edaphochlamys debaryana TaxID=47281 RepID=A0A835XJ73_9CHLO|nr:hypothetical protein HYH03_017029 [Edaphochlamys debaryana]|eukprot:KAG2484147.1 hypothetical protein HYH03_017029 [Edaphochlamys debaryana]